MKSAEPKSSTSSALQQKSEARPFFQQEESREIFFGPKPAETPFFQPLPTTSKPASPNPSPSSIQTKLKIGAPDDHFEREADATADKVVQRLAEKPGKAENTPTLSPKPATTAVQRKCAACEQEEQAQAKEEDLSPATEQVQMKPIFDSAAEPPPSAGNGDEIRRKPIFESNLEETAPSVAGAEGNVQRKCAECAAEEKEQVQKAEDGGSAGASYASPDVASRLQSSKGGGSALPADVSTSMGEAIGADFSGVRIHTGSEAVGMSKDLHAQAFTHGSDIYFNEGKYDTGSTEGKKLLAHELTHTVQQGGGVKLKLEATGNSNSTVKEKESLSPTAFRLAIRPKPGTKVDSEQIHCLTSSEPAKEPSGKINTDIVQRWPLSDSRSDRQLIDDAIRTRSVSDAVAINNVNLANDREKFDLIDIISHQGWVGPRDETQIERLWSSFGRRLSEVWEPNSNLWHHCISVGAELEDIQPVRNLRAEFIRDVHITAAGYLAGNRTIVNQEMQQFGIAEEAERPDMPLTATMTQRLQDMQSAARIVAQLQRNQEDLQRIPVGYNVQRGIVEGDPGSTYAVHFDPVSQPQMPPNDGEQGMRPWSEIKAKYDSATSVIATLTDRYPALYAISREGQSSQTQQFANTLTPAEARAQLGPALRRLLAHIGDAQTKLREREINPLDLLPIHRQLFDGRPVASGTLWNNRFPKWAADQELASHESEQFWTQLGLTSLSAAAFMLAPFTGGASLLVELVGLGAAGAQSMMSTQRYQALATAARTEVRSGTALVTAQQVSVAEQQMVADQIGLAVAAILVAVGIAVRGTSAIARALGDRPASLRVLLGEARYNEYAQAIEAIKAKHPELAGISTEELIAIRGYTDEDYARLNLALRSGDPAQIAQLQEYIQQATSGLRQLPPHRGVVNRAVTGSPDLVARYRPGEIVTESGFTSASMPGGSFQGGGTIAITIESTTGRNISMIARHVTEQEVLFMPGTRFRVVSATPVGESGLVVRMVDLGPP